MAARRGRPGLDEEQLSQLRSDLGAGRRPRVRVSGPQFSAGTTGAVRRVGDPGVDGEDFVTVRVKVGGVLDELRFSPSELSMAGGRQAPASTAALPTARRMPAPRRTRKPSPPTVVAAPEQSGAGGSGPDVSSAVAAHRDSSSTSVPAKTARPATRRAAPSASVSVTLASAGACWTVTALRGARVVVKNAVVPPGVVAAVAALLAQPLVEDAVAAVNDTARSEAEARAEQLRGELAAVEAVLQSHRRP